jgi:hypothetical protein
MTSASERPQALSATITLSRTATIDWLLRSAAGVASPAMMISELCNHMVTEGVVLSQNLNPDVLMMQPTQNRDARDAAEPFRAPKFRRILVQLEMRPDLIDNRKRNFSEREATAFRRTRAGDRGFRAESIR